MAHSHKLLLIDEVAAIARTTPSTVRHWIATGKLRSLRPGRRRLIDERDLDRFLQGTVDAPPRTAR